MKTRALIVDDEVGGRESLTALIDAHLKEVNILGSASSVATAFEAINELGPDLVFLDIEMQDGNAFDLLDRFDRLDFSIIFTTAFDHYAIKAIRFSALDYLLKPIDVEDLTHAYERYESKQKDKDEVGDRFKILLDNLKSDKKTRKIAIPDLDGMTFINISDIIRCHSDGSYTAIHLVGGKKMMASKPIGDYEELLSGDGFFRVHRSSMINLEHVSKYVKGEGGYVVMTDGAEVEVSRRKKNEFIASFNNY